MTNLKTHIGSHEGKSGCHEEGLSSPEAESSENWVPAFPGWGREAGWGGLLAELTFFPSIVPDSCTWKVQHPPRPMCFPSSPSSAGKEQMGVIYAQTLPLQPWHWGEGMQGQRPTQVPQTALSI